MKGIDVYHGDGWPLKAIPAKAYSESDFVIVKATQGVSYEHTSFFRAMIKKASTDGKLIGAYHYAAGGDPKKEADYFINTVKNYIGKAILCLDWERIQNDAWGSKTWAKTFIDRVKAKTGVTCFLYTGLDGMAQCKNLCGKVPLWFAGYPENENSWDIPKFKYDLGAWKKYAIWQFTSGREKVDRDITDLTKDQWKNHAKPGGKKMAKTAESLLKQAKAWIGCKEKDGSHKKIIDIYNAHKPLARSYKVKYTDSWCATFVSACAIASGLTDLIPTECSCNQMISLMKKKGIWVENENRVPDPGDIIFYDWQDSRKGDNKGSSDHVGIVEKVSKGKITVIEGNYQDSVKRRTISVNGKGIRGYGVPKYEDGKKGYTGILPKLPERGYFKKGDGMSTLKDWKTQIERVQRVVNFVMDFNLRDDGEYGKRTKEAVTQLQERFGLPPNGCFGAKCLKVCKAYKK